MIVVSICGTRCIWWLYWRCECGIIIVGGRRTVVVQKMVVVIAIVVIVEMMMMDIGLGGILHQLQWYHFIIGCHNGNIIHNDVSVGRRRCRG